MQDLGLYPSTFTTVYRATAFVYSKFQHDVNTGINSAQSLANSPLIFIYLFIYLFYFFIIFIFIFIIIIFYSDKLMQLPRVERAC